jgi:hypothetical protein
MLHLHHDNLFQICYVLCIQPSVAAMVLLMTVVTTIDGHMLAGETLLMTEGPQEVFSKL